MDQLKSVFHVLNNPWTQEVALFFSGAATGIVLASGNLGLTVMMLVLSTLVGAGGVLRHNLQQDTIKDLEETVEALEEVIASHEKAEEETNG